MKPSRPTITIISPTPNSTVGTHPTISFTTTSGDYLKQQVSLQGLSFKVDGVDKKLSAMVKTDIDDTLTEGVNFETLTISLSPTLTPGPHTVEVTAHSGYGIPTPENTSTVTWTFTVSTSGGGGGGGNQDITLPATKDTILSKQNPHRNEGANPLLQLSHRPEERNKGNNPLLAFDLSNVEQAGLRSARLQLTVQECDLPRKWGADGRQILAYPVNLDWSEGNGQTLRVGNQEQTRGTGAGVTWFSPVDTNIANRKPDGSEQWMGAQSFLGPITAPAVTVVNGQTGIIEFDVTQDVRTGFDSGWLIRKQDEGRFGNIRFYSKEGAAAAGSLGLAPKLILDYGTGTASVSEATAVAGISSQLGRMLSSLGQQKAPKLTVGTAGGELKTARQMLQENPVAQACVYQLIRQGTQHTTLLGVAAPIVFHNWLAHGPRLAWENDRKVRLGFQG